MEERYENVRSNFIEGVQAPNSSSLCPGEYAELSIINKQDTANQYATVEAVGQQKLMSSANRNEIDQPEGKVLTSKLPSRKKECCICCTALIFFLIFIVLGCALTAYNYYHLEAVKSQLKILKREFSQLEESSTNIRGIQQKQILYILENIELLNTSSIDQYKEYDTKIMEIKLRQLKVNENIEQLNISALEERSEIYYSLVHDMSLYSNISFHVNNIIDSIGLFEKYPASSCRYINALHPSWPSGYYWVIIPHGVTVHVYCYMGSLCEYYNHFNCYRGWTRIAKLNKIVNRAQCFMRLKNYPTNRSSCVTESDSATCSSTFFSSFDIPYSRIHGRIWAYGVGTPDGFRSSSLTINDNYVDGISLTVGNTAIRQHIHTLVPASGNCYRLSNRPTFVSYDYDCLPVLGTGSSQCSGYSCSQQFSKLLATPTTENVEMRICRDQSRSDEDIIIEDLEIYVT